GPEDMAAAMRAAAHALDQRSVVPRVFGVAPGLGNKDGVETSAHKLSIEARMGYSTLLRWAATQQDSQPRPFVVVGSNNGVFDVAKNLVNSLRQRTGHWYQPIIAVNYLKNEDDPFFRANWTKAALDAADSARLDSYGEFGRPVPVIVCHPDVPAH